jgi:hypothetical protein
MSKEDPEIKYTGYTEGDIKIKNEEELKEAKKAAGVTTHEKVREKFVEEEGQEKIDEIEWKKLYDEDSVGYKDKILEAAVRSLSEEEAAHVREVYRVYAEPNSRFMYDHSPGLLACIYFSGNHKEDIEETKKSLTYHFYKK